MILDFLAACASDKPFKEAFAKARCIRRGHVFDGSELIENLHSEKHPHSNSDFVYTVGIRRCQCGGIFHDIGLSYRAQAQVRRVK